MRRPEENESFKIENIEDARMLYVDICNGYSEIYLGEKENPVYWKHPTEIDNVYLISQQKRHEERAIEEGLQTEKQRIEEVIGLGLWTEKEEQDWTDTRDTLDWTRSQLSKLVLQSQIEHCQRDIDQYTKDLKKLDEVRVELVGMTAEVHANKKLNRDFVVTSIFKNKNCTKPLFSMEELEEQTEFMIEPWVQLVNVERLWYNQEDAFKRIAVWPFFMNAFFMIDENSVSFFGANRAAHDLTNYQSDLLSAGRFVKGVLSQSSKSPPEEHYKNLDKLIQWYSMQNAKIRSGKGQGSTRTSSSRGVQEKRRLG